MLERLDAGASLVGIGDGLAVSGPGLPKRMHEALRHRAEGAAPPARRGQGWVPMLLLGLGMIFPGALVSAWPPRA